MWIYAIVAAICLYMGMNILTSEERVTVFNKNRFEVKDVKLYNRYCAYLTFGFGAVTEVVLFLMNGLSGLWTMIPIALLIGEAVAVKKIYQRIEDAMRKPKKPGNSK